VFYSTRRASLDDVYDDDDDAFYISVTNDNAFLSRERNQRQTLSRRALLFKSSERREKEREKEPPKPKRQKLCSTNAFLLGRRKEEHGGEA
jgi:hypothetical protein